MASMHDKPINVSRCLGAKFKAPNSNCFGQFILRFTNLICSVVYLGKYICV